MPTTYVPYVKPYTRRVRLKNGAIKIINVKPSSRVIRRRKFKAVPVVRKRRGW